MEDKVLFEEVKPIFKCYKYWRKDDEYYWYENMWLILERKGLTSYKEYEDYYEIILMAVALVIIFTDHIALKYDECDLHDYFYSNVISDMITEFNLGALYYKHTQTVDDGLEDYNYVVEYLAEILKDKVYDAIQDEIGSKAFFLSMEAVDEGIKHTVRVEDEDEEYYEDEIFEPSSAKEFWDAFNGNMDQVSADTETKHLDISSTVYGWVDDGCAPVL